MVAWLRAAGAEEVIAHIHPGHAASAAVARRLGLQCHAISNHLVGQAVCDIIDERHKAILSPQIWGDGKPEGVNKRAAEEMKATAKAAQKLGVSVVAPVSV
mgnify:CR=1 FL=1